LHTHRSMMSLAPIYVKLADECNATQDNYGCPCRDNRSFAWQCLIAARLVEHGVRVVEFIDTGSSNNWDAHGDMQEHRGKARRVDRAIAALIQDIKQRGLFKETLIAV